ncbi:MAG: hypothetical protein U0271_26725 [Polyangiaceae bacterium]
MLPSRLWLLVPAAETLVLVAVLIGPGQTRPVRYARLLSTGDALRSARVVVVERDELREEGVAEDVALFVAGEGTPRWRGRTAADGTADLVLDEPIAAGAELVVATEDKAKATRARGPLGDGRGERATLESPTFAVLRGGGLELRVDVDRGVLVAPFPEVVTFSLTDSSGRPVSGSVSFTGVSVNPESGAIELSSEGRGSVELTGLAQPAQLTCTVRAADKELSGDVVLPVAMSGLDATLDGEELRITSPSPRAAAYIGVYNAAGRLVGYRAGLRDDGRGYFTGSLNIQIPRDASVIVVSSDPAEAGSGTVARPAPEQRGRAGAPTLAVVLDGKAAAIAAEKTRAGRVRTFALVGLGLAAVFELGLLLWSRRNAQRALERLDRVNRDVQAGIEGDAEPGELGRTTWPMVLAIALLVVTAAVATAGLTLFR